MKKELLFDERSNSRVWEIESLEDLNSLVYSIGDDDTCYYKNYTFKVKRVNNDVYGNPLYKFVLCKDFENITREWSEQNGKTLSVSVGFVKKQEYPEKTVSELAKIADARMYQDKEQYYRENGKIR